MQRQLLADSSLRMGLGEASTIFGEASGTRLLVKSESNSDHPPPPIFEKNCPPNLPYNWVPHGTEVLKIKGFLQRIWHTDPKIRPPPFMPYEPFRLGVRVVFDLLKEWSFLIMLFDANDIQVSAINISQMATYWRCRVSSGRIANSYGRGRHVLRI